MKIIMKNLYLINSVVFAVVAFAHLWRVLANISVSFNSFALPMWVSYAAIIVAGILSYKNWISIPRRTMKTCALWIAGVVFIDFLGILFSWYYGLTFFGFSGSSYMWPALFDAVVVLACLWYAKK